MMAVRAVIHIAASEIRLKVGQTRKGVFSVLESAAFPLNLGRDTFTLGKVSFEKADKACEIIRNFAKIAREHGAEKIRLMATSALREAANKEYIADQIALKTGLAGEILDNYDEKHYIFKLTCDMLDARCKQSALVAFIGSGNLGAAYFENGFIPYIQNVRVGSLRISETFGTLQDFSPEFHVVVEQYLSGFTNFIRQALPSGIKNFVATGNEIPLIARLCAAERSGDFLHISRKSFENLFDNIKDMSTGKISAAYKISQEQAETLMPAMCIYGELLRFTSADKILSPHVYLTDAVLYEELYPERFDALNKFFDKNSVISAKTLAEKFLCDMEHCEAVLKFSEEIFDKLKRLHGMGEKERLILQVAAVLHDCGNFINPRGHAEHSYDIIKGLDITGLNSRQRELAACVSRYHSKAAPSEKDAVYAALSRKERVAVSKLAAILRAADALDNSHERKIAEIDVKLDDGELVVTAACEKDIELEKWSFAEKSKFFEEVFGVKAIIKKKRV